MKAEQVYKADYLHIDPNNAKIILSGEIKWFILQPKNQKQKKLCQTLQQK
jgi:hypothetical protein